MYLNKATIIGNITRDPELKALPSGQKVCNFSVATNEVYKDKDGQKQESVEFHNVICFGNTADNVARYMKKGSQILIEGKIQTRSWEDKETQKKVYRTEILAQHIQFGNKSSGTTPSGTTPESVETGAAADPVVGGGYDGDLTPTNTDDIPF